MPHTAVNDTASALGCAGAQCEHGMKLADFYAGQVIEAGACDTQWFHADPAVPAQGRSTPVQASIGLLWVQTV